MLGFGSFYLPVPVPVLSFGVLPFLIASAVAVLTFSTKIFAMKSMHTYGNHVEMDLVSFDFWCQCTVPHFGGPVISLLALSRAAREYLGTAVSITAIINFSIFLEK